MPNEGRSISLRPAAPDDHEFLIGLYGSVREAELALTGWPADQRDAFVRMQFDAQQIHYRRHYPTGVNQIILMDGRPVGRIYWADLKDEVHFLDITIAPEHRSQGIGTPIITKLLELARAQGKPARIFIESYNRSLRLFQRLGFTCAKEDGCLLLLEWRAQGAA